MVRIGRRGDVGSGRYVRCYDKGLERGMHRGTWHRWEAELSGSCAEQVQHALVDSHADWLRTMVEIAFGCVDFRIGEKRRAVEARERVDWWAVLLDGVRTCCVRAERTLSTAAGKLSWLRNSVGPMVKALVETSGGRMADVFRRVFSETPEGSVERHVRDRRCEEILKLAGLMPGVGLQRRRAFACGA
jgi:DNA relaxase NicK